MGASNEGNVEVAVLHHYWGLALCSLGEMQPHARMLSMRTLQKPVEKTARKKDMNADT